MNYYCIKLLTIQGSLSNENNDSTTKQNIIDDQTVTGQMNDDRETQMDSNAMKPK